MWISNQNLGYPIFCQDWHCKRSLSGFYDDSLLIVAQGWCWIFSRASAWVALVTLRKLGSLHYTCHEDLSWYSAERTHEERGKYTSSRRSNTGCRHPHISFQSLATCDVSSLKTRSLADVQFKVNRAKAHKVLGMIFDLCVHHHRMRNHILLTSHSEDRELAMVNVLSIAGQNTPGKQCIKQQCSIKSSMNKSVNSSHLFHYAFLFCLDAPPTGNKKHHRKPSQRL